MFLSKKKYLLIEDETMRLESRYSNKKLSLPPISIVSNAEKKDDLLSNFKFERYEPNFKHQDNLPSNKLPTSIKTSRPNAVPNISVSLRIISLCSLTTQTN